MARDFCVSLFRTADSKAAPPATGPGKFEVEFEFTAVPPNLRLAIYIMGAFVSRKLHSGRFDFKARARPGDLESRRDWRSAESTIFTGEVYALPPP